MGQRYNYILYFQTKTQYIINYMNKSIKQWLWQHPYYLELVVGWKKRAIVRPNRKETENVIGRSDIKVKDGRMTPEVLWAMGRIWGMKCISDGQKVVYTVAYGVPENRSNREVFVMNADGTDNKQITKTSYSENEAVWIKGGKKIAFLCNESGSSQLWEMNPDGSDRRQL